MGSSHDSHEKKKDEPKVPARTYSETRMQPRVRPQWDPAELARKYLDDMESDGRLHEKFTKS